MKSHKLLLYDEKICKDSAVFLATSTAADTILLKILLFFQGWSFPKNSRLKSKGTEGQNQVIPQNPGFL